MTIVPSHKIKMMTLFLSRQAAPMLSIERLAAMPAVVSRRLRNCHGIRLAEGR
jgi:hypothetical protein